MGVEAKGVVKMSEQFDSTRETLEHRSEVQYRLMSVWINLVGRGERHDQSKLFEPEKSILDEWTPKLRSVPYGSQEYWDMLAESSMGEFLEHHYANNSHHPEYWPNGINDMTLMDVIEMLADWSAAVKRHEDGDILKSLEINKGRFGISDQLYSILLNTVREMEW